ncbi:MAG: site-specific integrase [Oscillospiraceae bacterium]|nr:site-specific integrase [Oscillospiraceae bacterium]
MPIYKVEGTKKDGLQKYKVRINYTNNYGAIKQLTRIVYGFEEAKDIEQKLLHEVKEKLDGSYGKTTIDELFTEYIATKKHDVRKTTAHKYENIYELYIKPKLEGVKLCKLTIPLLQKWKSYVEEMNVNVTTRNHAYAVLRILINYAVRMEYISSNPLVALGCFKDADYKKAEINYYTASEFLLYINKAKQYAEKREAECRSFYEWDYYVFFNIAFYTGMRKGEILALKWSDIDCELINITRSLQQKVKGETNVETPPKSRASIRTLQMPLPLIKVLNEHRKRQEHMERFTEDYRVCGGQQPINGSNLGDKNSFYANLSGQKRIRVHDFRHSHVSILANENINIKEIARRLGHAKVELTWNTYSHLYPREQEKAVCILNQIA